MGWCVEGKQFIEIPNFSLINSLPATQQSKQLISSKPALGDVHKVYHNVTQERGGGGVFGMCDRPYNFF